MRTEYVYVGQELELFSKATHWKSYWSTIIKPSLGSDVLEVGAGIGSNIELLCTKKQKRWLSLEPDVALLKELRARINENDLRSVVEATNGIVSDLASTEQFDTILYIDVLEHIENDREELRSASQHLHHGGNLLVLAPAHQVLFSPFDEAVGHFRRYTKESMQRIAPADLRLDRIYYLDSAGLFASAANKLLLRKALPTEKQILFWDRFLVPISTFVDPIIRFKVGKSLLVKWTKV